jgi:glycosyltransferase involved in cell wall biosynthesis
LRIGEEEILAEKWNVGLGIGRLIKLAFIKAFQQRVIYMENRFSSLCILAYKRPQELKVCLESLLQTIDSPCEIIINFDGVESMVDIMHTFPTKFSKLIVNRGKNRGVGRSFQNCLGLAEGEFIAKLDADLTFTSGWLSKAVKVLENNPDIGCLGLFDYSNWDPNDERFKPKNNVIEKREDCVIVKDFVSSAYIFRAKDKSLIEPVQDDGNHGKLGKLALINVVDSKTFGVGKSVYVVGTMEDPRKAETYDSPLIFKEDLS